MPTIISGSTGISGTDGTAATPAIQGTDTNTGIFFPAADTIAFAEGGTEVMRIDSAGNVGIGTSSPASRLDVRGGNGTGGLTSPSGTWAAQVLMNQDSNAFNGLAVSNRWAASTSTIFEAAMGWNGSSPGYYPVFTIDGLGQVIFRPQRTESMRIASNGDVYIGTATAFDNVSFNKAQVSGGLSTFINTTGATTQVSFFNPNGRVGFIGTSGTSTSYNTSSDYRLKENLVPLANAADRVLALKPYRFNFIGDTTRVVDGFLAHEAAEVVPEAVNGEKDAVDASGLPIYQGIDQSKLVPLLTAALQEALSKIDALETRIVTLENI